MKTIGFVDYYISEWHANNYPEWIKQASEKLGKEFCVKYAYSEREDSPFDGRSADDWCKDFGVTRCKTIEELCEKADYILVLAPSDPETHLRLSEKVLKFGKNTYIDKTFAESYDTAKKIFEIAEKYNTKFFSTSALRFADELTPYVGKIKEIKTYGTGRLIEEYIIHQIEMVVKCLGIGAKSVVVNKDETAYNIEINYNDDRKGKMYFGPNTGFKFDVLDNGETKQTAVTSSFFNNLIYEILKFYDTGVLPFDTNQTLEVMKIRTGLINGLTKLGKEIIL